MKLLLDQNLSRRLADRLADAWFGPKPQRSALARMTPAQLRYCSLEDSGPTKPLALLLVA